MRFSRLKKVSGLLIAPLMVFVASTASVPQIAQAGIGNTLTGIQCMPTSLDQALGRISWNHMRVQNDHTSALWVVCSGVNDSLFDGTDIWLTATSSQIMTAWFGPSAASGAEVTCISREVSGSGSATTGSSSSVTITASSIPSTKTGSTSGTGFSLFQPITVTCKLDPGAGLQGVYALFQIL